MSPLGAGLTQRPLWGKSERTQNVGLQQLVAVVRHQRPAASDTELVAHVSRGRPEVDALPTPPDGGVQVQVGNRQRIAAQHRGRQRVVRSSHDELWTGLVPGDGRRSLTAGNRRQLGVGADQTGYRHQAPQGRADTEQVEVVAQHDGSPTRRRDDGRRRGRGIGAQVVDLGEVRA
jgi:hypothetical protein